MPVEYGLFQFAGAPRTATTWIKHAADAAGLKGGGFVHMPHVADHSRIKLSTVRHPAEWLRSYWAAIWPAQIQIDLIDDLHKACEGARTFDEFVRMYLNSEWRMSQMLAGYGADVVIRVEDLPWAFLEFLSSLEVPRRMVERCLLIPAVNTAKNNVLPKWNPSLRARVLEAEADFIRTYEY